MNEILGTSYPDEIHGLYCTVHMPQVGCSQPFFYSVLLIMGMDQRIACCYRDFEEEKTRRIQSQVWLKI